jgi:kinesin family member 1
METSEKLMQSLNETWEEKMLRTQEVQKEREKALEELGITVEKNLVGVHTPKKVCNMVCDLNRILLLFYYLYRCHIWST